MGIDECPVLTELESNYFNMSKTVCDVFENSKNVWENKALLSAAYNRLKTLCESIGEVAAKQKENAPEGYTAAKEIARTTLEDKLFIISRKLHTLWGLADVVAAEQSKFSRSSLDELSLNNLLNLARAIAEVCRVRLDRLKAYEIDETTLTDLQTAIGELSTMNAHRDAVMDCRMENTSSISKLLATMRRELKTTDALVEGFVSDEAFLAVYFNARRVHDVRGGARKKDEAVKE